MSHMAHHRNMCLVWIEGSGYHKVYKLCKVQFPFENFHLPSASVRQSLFKRPFPQDFKVYKMGGGLVGGWGGWVVGWVVLWAEFGLFRNVSRVGSLLGG